MRSDRRWCLRASRLYCWQAGGTRINRPSACGGRATIVALFIRGGEGNPHDVLLANFPALPGTSDLSWLPPTQECGFREFANSIPPIFETSLYLTVACKQRYINRL